MFATAGKWFRLIVASALSELMREERGLPVLALLDEFAQLGHLKAMRDAMGQSAGMGLQVLPILQDLNQLKTHYKDGWETFLANTEFRMFFKSNDVFTQDYVSKLSGLQTVKVPNSGFGESSGGGSNSSSANVGLGEQSQPVLQPYEVGRIGPDEFVMFAHGVENTIRGVRAPYFDKERCPELQGLYSPDPYHLPK
jgi:type IV secretion system protein VirD4